MTFLHPYRLLLVPILLSGLFACSSGGSDDPAAAPIPPTPAPDPAPAPPVAGEFAAFESGPVRPLALSSDGNTLYAVNTPDGHLEIFDVSSGTPLHRESVAVGMEPVAVAVSPDGKAWVVNHLSDSVSIVDTRQSPARVVRTLYVGDEPRDIVFAGPQRSRAFITAAHRGQNTGFDPRSFTPGTGRADVWVFESDDQGDSMGGTPLGIVNLFGDVPRALAVSPDGSEVYAAIFHSGNRTTTLEADIRNGGLEKPPPLASADSQPQPRTGLIVKYDGEHWRDHGDPTTGVEGKIWDDRVRFTLPDQDVFAIDANATPPVQTAAASGVGTTLFNMAVNPVNGKLYVSNTEARNHVRFEGPGSNSTTVRGHFVESRITVVTRNAVSPRHLNKHITSYDQALGSNAEKRRSLATPLEMAISADGRTLYVAAFGSGRIGVFGTTALENDSFSPNANSHIPVSGGGPAGLVLDTQRRLLYVATRFDNGLSAIDLASEQEIAHLTLPNPEPESLVAGRPFLYDARLTSSRGDSSCAGCHVFGDLDQLAWDLGNPDEVQVASPNTYNNNGNGGNRKPFFHPMKGPMTTQSFRGMRGNGPLHWRGDRTGVDKDGDETIEEQAFEDFNPAFTGLLGRDGELSEAQMDLFANFALQLDYPPNPIRALDNSLTAEQAAGEDFYLNELSTANASCNDCHTLDPARGQFGTNGTQTVEGPSIDEDFKIPHLRNMYQKIGMFGSTGNPGLNTPDMGPQIRGFGYANDGSKATLVDFLSDNVFRFPNNATRRQVSAFVTVFPSDHAPIVGQQLTLGATAPTGTEVQQRLALLMERASLANPECELIAKGVIDGARFGAVLNEEGSFTPAVSAGPAIDLEALQSAVSREGNALTFTCVPLGNGTRMGIDRDQDGVRDGD